MGIVSFLVCIVVVVFCVLLSSYVYLLYCVCIAFVFFTLYSALLARSRYSEGPATGHLDTGFSRFPCFYKQMLRRFPTFQVATTCFSCSPLDLNLAVTNFMFCLHVKLPLPPGDNPIAVNKYYYYYYHNYYYSTPVRTTSEHHTFSVTNCRQAQSILRFR